MRKRMNRSDKNVISLRAYRSIKECRKLFLGYDKTLKKMSKVELLMELEKYRLEAKHRPTHLLTLIKGEILMAQIQNRAVSKELVHFASQENNRLKSEISKKVSFIH